MQKKRVIITAKMGNGTIQAKLEPLSQMELIDIVYFLRKEAGPVIPKVEYILLPKSCRYPLIHLLITPFILSYYTILKKADLIVGYHFIPYAFFAYVASLITRRKFVVCQTGTYIQRYSNRKIHWAWIKYLISKAYRFCNPGKSSFEHWTNKGVPKDKLIILHSTVDTTKYIPSNIEPNYDFIYVGRFSPEKRVDLLLNAYSQVIEKYPLSKLALVGGGRDVELVTKLVNDLNLNDNVFFMGFQKNVLPYLHQAKYIIISSDSEGLPCSIMEGMSCGLVPISTNVGNLSDLIIENFNGFLVAKGSITGLSNSMMKALELPRKDYLDFSERCRELIVEEHSHTNSIKKWSEIINSLYSDRG
jgi:glycosyltransferase involved in cell wall biosynthesis